MSTTLYRKYRPAKFSDIIGQKHIVRTLSNAILNNRIGQAYLFTGSRGTGKTTMARLFAQSVNCLKPVKDKNSIISPCLKCENCQQFQSNQFTDIIEIDAASNTGVDNIRELRETAKLSPLQGKYKVYIIDEVHMLSQGAFNALLKILEEPPTHIIFILATTEIHKVPETIISRCQRFDFSKFNIDEIIDKLSKIAKEEKIKIDTDALELIAISAEGGMRDAESLLEQVITLEKNNISAEKVAEILGISDNQTIEKLTELVFVKDASAALLLINQIYKDGTNIELFTKNWLDYLRKVMIFKIDDHLEKKLFSKLTKEQKEKISAIAQNTSLFFITELVNKVSEIIPKIKDAFISQLPLESLIVEITCDKNSEKNISSNISTSTPIAPKVSQPQKDLKKEPTEETPVQIQETAPKKEIEDKIEEVKEEKTEEIIKNKVPAQPINIYEVEKNWKAILDELRQENCSLSMMLSNSKPIQGKQDGAISIVIRHSFQKDLINKPENRLTIADVSSKITGLAFKVEAVTEEESGIKLKKILPEISQELIDQECNVANKPASQDSLLSDAMALMGGKIVTNEQ